ncbi:glycosyltransferase family 2 protein [Myceligenerans salitolerans]|uniref:Glycosyltransferase family 2 protein n=1 Tax=Myceligenerans salitolerans TaxID=1230528 RepID=A0ABS3IAM7_9MICO|nr:glycosyltransferase family A protein [Myceligenerans salitolerans]MBO0609419.1 glycosyltransferase family 2 protein [Myceligenerans salitolerans]
MYSVVIPCHNGEHTLRRQLDALRNQDFTGEFEVVVADNRSTDSTPQIVEGLRKVDPRFRIVPADRVQGINHARNAGVRAARGDFILLCDDDDIVLPGWITAMDAARRQGHMCLGGLTEHRLRDDTYLFDQPGIIPVPWADVPRPIGANCGFARQVFDQIGGFDESILEGPDDTDFFWRAHFAGYPSHPVPSARVIYYVKSDLDQLLRQGFRRGGGRVKLYRKYRSKGMPRMPLLKSVPKFLGGTVLAVFAPKRSSIKRRTVQYVGFQLGCVAGSFRERVFYF